MSLSQYEFASSVTLSLEYQPQKTVATSPEVSMEVRLKKAALLHAKKYFPDLSVQDWIEKAQWQAPESRDPIPDTESFSCWPKRLKAIGSTYPSFCNLVRQITSLGWSADEFDVLAAGNRSTEDISKKIHTFLVIFQRALIDHEFNGELPLSPYGAALRELNQRNRISKRMALVIQNQDGSWPKFDLNKYGSGVFAIGNSEPDWH